MTPISPMRSPSLMSRLAPSNKGRSPNCLARCVKRKRFTAYAAPRRTWRRRSNPGTSASLPHAKFSRSSHTVAATAPSPSPVVRDGGLGVITALCSHRARDSGRRGCQMDLAPRHFAHPLVKPTTSGALLTTQPPPCCRPPSANNQQSHESTYGAGIGGAPPWENQSAVVSRPRASNP